MKKQLVLSVYTVEAPFVFEKNVKPFMLERSIAELDTKYRHIIPYVAILCRNKIAVYKRSGNEKRLVDLYSVGFGGHIDEEDVVYKNGYAYNSKILEEEFGYREEISLETTVINCMRRELMEEVGLDSTKYPAERLSNIIFNSSAVDSVHLGIPFVIRIPNFEEVSTSNEVKRILWRTRQDVEKLKLESWSVDVLRQLKERNIF